MMNLKHTLLIAVGATTLSASAQMSKNKQENIAQFKEIAASKNVPAVQIAYWDGKKIDKYSIGYKNATTKDTVSEFTVFEAASLTKVVASYVYLVLSEKGLFDLDQPLSKYYTYERMSEDPHKDLITARHVLTHSSGLVNWEANAGSEAWKVSKMNTKFTPGEKYMYSGEAMYYLQLTVEHLTGKSLSVLAKEIVFDPFAMKNSSLVYEDKFAKDIAFGHGKEAVPFRTFKKYRTPSAAFTMYTTATDYMNFLISVVIDGKGLSKKMHKDFLTANRSIFQENSKNGGYQKKNICLGIMQQVNEVGTAYCHTGSNPGFRALFLIYPKERKALTLLSNANDGALVRKPILDYVFGSKQTFWAIR